MEETIKKKCGRKPLGAPTTQWKISQQAHTKIVAISKKQSIEIATICGKLLREAIGIHETGLIAQGEFWEYSEQLLKPNSGRVKEASKNQVKAHFAHSDSQEEFKTLFKFSMHYSTEVVRKNVTIPVIVYLLVDWIMSKNNDDAILHIIKTSE